MLTPYQSIWRNEITSVISMLNDYHADRYLILNLSERVWNYKKANHSVYAPYFHLCGLCCGTLIPLHLFR